MENNVRLSENVEFLLKDRYYMKDSSAAKPIVLKVKVKEGKVCHRTSDEEVVVATYGSGARLVGEQEIYEIGYEDGRFIANEVPDGDYSLEYIPLIEETSWEQLCRRVARYIALAELNYSDSIEQVRQIEQKFFEMLYKRLFLPNSPTLFNAGKGMIHLTDNEGNVLLHKELLKDYEYIKLYNFYKNNPDKVDGMMSACFVLPIDDSMEDIFDAVKNAALVMKAGGGVGFNFSKLRPQGSEVSGTAGYSSGPISFINLLNETGKVIEQGGRRRSAMMGILDSTHMDIEKFIEAKRNNDGKSVLNYFNISVNVRNPEDFADKVDSGAWYKLSHPKHNEVRWVNAKDLLKKISEFAWKTGDPGLVFIDRHNKYYSLANIEPVEATNPCGEEPLPPFGSCNLLSINLYNIFKEAEVERIEDLFGYIEFERFISDIIKTAVRFLDNVIDMNRYPIKEIEEKTKLRRPIGLGYMGLHDAMMHLGIPYASDDGVGFIAYITGVLAYHSYDASHWLALERGAFPLFNKSRFNNEAFVPFSMFDPERCGLFSEEVKNLNFDLRESLRTFMTSLRHSQINTIAPTGSISNIAEVSSGLEPNFMLCYTRYVTQKDGSRVPLTIVNRVILDKFDEETIEKIKETGKFDTDDPVFKTAQEIDYKWHIAAQEAAQAYIDASVSKTINLPNETTVEEIFDIYMYALKSNLKGITIYRDGSLTTQVLTTKKKEEKKEEKSEKSRGLFFNISPAGKLLERPRPDSLIGVSRKFTTEKGTTFINVNFDENGYPFDVFVNDNREKAEIIGRLSSHILRLGGDFNEIIETLMKVKSGDYARKVAEALKQAVEDFKKLMPAIKPKILYPNNDQYTKEELDQLIEQGIVEWSSKGFYIHKEKGATICPVCGGVNSIHMESGCMECAACGYSKCS